MYLNTTLCKGQVDLNWPLRWGLLGTLGCSSVGDDSHENASSLGCCAGGGFGESIWDEGVWWRWGERCVALIQVRKNQGWRYHWSINKLCKRQWTRQMPRVSPTLGNFSWALPMAPWMTWGDAVELYMKQTPTTEASLEEYRKASPAALLRGLRKKKGSIYQQNDIFVGKPHLKKRPVTVAGYFARSIPCSSIIPETCSTFYCESSLFGGLLSYGSPVRFGIWRINKLQHELFGVNFADSRTPPRVQL